MYIFYSKNIYVCVFIKTNNNLDLSKNKEQFKKLIWYFLGVLFFWKYTLWFYGGQTKNTITIFFFSCLNSMLKVQ